MAVPPVFVAGQVLTAAQMNQIGLWQVKAKTSFTAATSVTVDNVFTSDFQDYLLILRYETSTAAQNINYQNRVGGVSATTNYNFQRLLVASTTVSGARTTAQASFPVGLGTGPGYPSLASVIISGPQLAGPTNATVHVSHADNSYAVPIMWYSASNHSTAVAYDGFELSVGGGANATGNYTVWGFRP
jgi:hypothetical protein